MMRRLIVGFLVAVALASCGTAEPVIPPDQPTVTVVTAEDVVAFMERNDPTIIDQFCTAYFTLGDYNVAFNAFASTYDVASPSADEVFDELLARC